MKDLATIELAYGRVDTAIGKYVAFPIVRRLARPFGNFLLARLLVFVATVGEVCWLILLHASIGNVLLVVFANVLVGASLFAFHIRRMEKASARINGDNDTIAIPPEVWVAARSVAWLRKVYLVLALLGAAAQSAPVAVTFAVLALALYATTCIVPRRPSKIAAKVRAGVAAARQSLVPAMAGVPS